MDLNRQQIVVESWMFALTFPAVLLARQWPKVAAVCAAIAFACMCYTRLSRWLRQTSRWVAVPVTGLIVSLALAATVSPVWSTAGLPFSARLLWSFALFIWLTSALGSRPRALKHPFAVIGLVFLGLGVAGSVLAVFAMPSDRMLPLIAFLHDHILWLSTDRFGVPYGFPTNEVGGWLILFLPLAVMLAVVPLRTLRGVKTPKYKRVFFRLDCSNNLLRILVYRAVTIGIATWFALVLLITQSRGALGAVLIGMAVLMCLLGKRPRIAVAVAGVALLIFVLTPAADAVVRHLAVGGGNQGVSRDIVLSGRPDIWRSAWWCITDFPFSGMGVASFGLVGPGLYPWKNVVDIPMIEDAHNLFLQAWLDFGLGGFICFLALLGYVTWVSVRAWRSMPERSIDRYWMAGLLAGCWSHLVYSVVDATTHGSVGNVFFWIVLGLLFGTAQLSSTKPLKIMTVDFRNLPVVLKVYRSMFVSVAVIVVLFCVAFVTPNRYGFVIGNHLWARDMELEEAMDRLDGSSNARARWYLGLIHLYHDHSAEAVEHWRRAIQAKARFIVPAQSYAPGALTLAETATKHHPRVAAGWFWAADLTVDDDPALAVSLLREGLTHDPKAGLQWRQLADLVRAARPEEALAAYINSCENGDPGAHGCSGAAKMYEDRGETRMAVRYYRRSNFAGHHRKADELEKGAVGGR